MDVNEEFKFLGTFKIQNKKNGGGGGGPGGVGENRVGGVRVDVNKELKFL